MRNAARCALIATIAFGLVCCERYLSRNNDGTAAYPAKPEMMFGTVWKNVVVSNFAPQKETAISFDQFLHVRQRDRHRAGGNLLTGGHLEGSFLRSDNVTFREIRFGVFSVPFNCRPQFCVDRWSWAEIFHRNNEIRSSEFRGIGLAISPRLKCCGSGYLSAPYISPQLYSTSPDLLGNGFISAMKIISADASGNRQYDSRHTENHRPARDSFIIAFGFWVLGGLIGLIGLTGMLYHDRADLFLFALILAGVFGYYGAGFL